jgi:glycosyltransferase involved in cell wall biosynthesis
MKLLAFTSLYPNNVWPNHGVFIKERLTKLAEHQPFQIKIVAPVPYFPPIKVSPRWRFSQVRRFEQRDGLDVYHPRYFMVPKVSMILHGFLVFLATYRLVRKLSKTYRFDLIDAHYVYPDALAAVLIGILLKKPVVVSVRGSDINVLREFPIIRRMLKFTFRKSQHVITVSEALASLVVQMGIPRSKVSVISNGIDVKKFFPVPRNECKKKLGLPQGQLLLSVGRLTENKGFHLLVRALSEIRKGDNHYNLHLAIIGHGTFREELVTEIKASGMEDYVRLVGEVAHDDLVDWYNAADIFCLASATEGWPNVVMESLACGTPVVATAVGGIPEILGDSRYGLLSERNAEVLATQIICALEKSWDRDELFHFARTRTWESVATRLSQLYHAL